MYGESGLTVSPVRRRELAFECPRRRGRSQDAIAAEVGGELSLPIVMIRHNPYIQGQFHV